MIVILNVYVVDSMIVDVLVHVLIYRDRGRVRCPVSFGRAKNLHWPCIRSGSRGTFTSTSRITDTSCEHVPDHVHVYDHVKDIRTLFEM